MLRAQGSRASCPRLGRLGGASASHLHASGARRIYQLPHAVKDGLQAAGGLGSPPLNGNWLMRSNSSLLGGAQGHTQRRRFRSTPVAALCMAQWWVL